MGEFLKLALIQKDMINLKELRLNNWVYSLEVGGYVQISSIDSEFVTLKNHVTWDYVYADMIEPIPLTEEILLKCGFERDHGILVYDIFELGLDGDDFAKMQYTLIIDEQLVVKVKHLHQLQNLIHALTGEELKMQL